MHITVKLFALMREKAGTDVIRLQVSDDSDVAQALTVLAQQHPPLVPYLANARVALHMDFVEHATRLTEGDEVALIPPVSGGA